MKCRIFNRCYKKTVGRRNEAALPILHRTTDKTREGKVEIRPGKGPGSVTAAVMEVEGRLANTGDVESITRSEESFYCEKPA